MKLIKWEDLTFEQQMQIQSHDWDEYRLNCLPTQEEIDKEYQANKDRPADPKNPF